jgi:hypothetical protein
MISAREGGEELGWRKGRHLISHNTSLLQKNVGSSHLVKEEEGEDEGEGRMDDDEMETLFSGVGTGENTFGEKSEGWEEHGESFEDSSVWSETSSGQGNPVMGDQKYRDAWIKGTEAAWKAGFFDSLQLHFFSFHPLPHTALYTHVASTVMHQIADLNRQLFFCTLFLIFLRLRVIFFILSIALKNNL